MSIRPGIRYSAACFPTLDIGFMFPVLDLGCIFPRAWDGLHVFPCLKTVADVFPRLKTIARFPALNIGYMFFLTWHWLHVIPRLKPVTRLCFEFCLSEEVIYRHIQVIGCLIPCRHLLTSEWIWSWRCLLSYCNSFSVLQDKVNNLIQEHLAEIIPL